MTPHPTRAMMRYWLTDLALQLHGAMIFQLREMGTEYRRAASADCFRGDVFRFARKWYPSAESMLNLTPPDKLTDGKGRPYFLWDCDLTVADFRARLQDGNPDVRAYFLAKAMRQARPDDVFQFVSVEEIRESWPRVVRHLGRARPFWTWLLETWERQDHGVRQP